MISLLLLLSLAGGSAAPRQTAARTESTSVEDLVRRLAHGRGFCTISNSSFRTEKHAALRLIEIGEIAKAPLEKAVNDVEAGGQLNPCGVAWLLYAYARVHGAAAFPRLARMLENPRLSRLNRPIEIAMAGSLALTSVITSWDRVDRLYGDTEMLRGLPDSIIPQQSLDSFLLGLLTDKQNLVDASLNPAAREVFERLVSVHTWEGLRRRFLPAASDALHVIGYRLSLPDGVVEPLRPDFRFTNEPWEKQPAGTVEFYRDGKPCASQRIRFEDVKGRIDSGTNREWDFAIASTDFEVLLASIGKCVAASRTAAVTGDVPR